MNPWKSWAAVGLENSIFVLLGNTGLICQRSCHLEKWIEGSSVYAYSSEMMICYICILLLSKEVKNHRKILSKMVPELYYITLRVECFQVNCNHILSSTVPATFWTMLCDILLSRKVAGRSYIKQTLILIKQYFWIWFPSWVFFLKQMLFPATYNLTLNSFRR